MRLDQALVHKGLCESRTEAQECISQGFVLLNGAVSTKQTKQVSESDKIEVLERRKFVSRGGDKLEGALMHIYGTQDHAESVIRGMNAIDIGSSTGGFTDCLLSHGVKSVVAVDVGTSQIHSKLKNDARVSFFENTDIRNFKTNTQFDMIVADVSFIALEKIMDTILTFATHDTKLFLLIKPQFEVGKGNTKKGIVKDEALLDEVLIKYRAISQEKGLSSASIFPSSIVGGDGNREYFLYGVCGESFK